MIQCIALSTMIIPLSLMLSGCDAAEELGINWHGLLGQIIAFGILLGILLLVAYRPVTRMLDERSKRVKDSMDQAEFIKKETARTEQRVQEQLAEARKQGQNIVARAEQIAERLKEEARQQAKQDAEALIARARSEMQAENDEAISRLRREFVDIAIQAAEKVISRALDKEAHRQLIEQTLQDSTKLNKEE